MSIASQLLSRRSRDFNSGLSDSTAYGLLILPSIIPLLRAFFFFSFYKQLVFLHRSNGKWTPVGKYALAWFNAQCPGARLQLFRDGGVWVRAGPLPWEGRRHAQAETSQAECASSCESCGHLPVTHTENKCTELGKEMPFGFQSRK